MSIIIQKKENSINIVNTELTAGQQIEITMPPNCIARQQGNHSIVEFLSIDRRILKSVLFVGIEYQDLAGVPTLWAGNFDDFLNKLNNEYFDETVTAAITGSISVTGVSSEAKQDDQLTQATNYFAKKNIGKIINLAVDQGGTWNGYPITFLPNELIGFLLKFDNVEYNIPNDNTIDNVVELVSLLNELQSYIVFSAIDSTHLLINDGTFSIDSLEQFFINSANNGVLFYETFTDSVDVPLSNTDVINENIKVMRALSKAAADTLEAINTALGLQAKLTDTQPVSLASIPLPTDAAKDGTDITTPTPMPTGGVGIRGWLSAIWTKLNGSLAVTGTFFQATQPVSAASLPLPSGAATSSKQDSEITLLTSILAAVGGNYSSFGSDSGNTVINLPTAATEYLVAAFRVKTGLGSVSVKKMITSIKSASNDDLVIRLRLAPTLSVIPTAVNYASVSAASKIEVARPGILGLAVNITASGGRIVHSIQATQNTDFMTSEDTPIVIPEGVLYVVTATPRSTAGAIYDSENWVEMQ